jgi:hypothetical protein
MTRPARVFLLSGASLVVIALVALIGIAAREGGNLQQYEAAMRAKGEKLSFAELTSGRQTNALDSHEVITNAASKLASPRLSPGLIVLRQYTGPGRAQVTWAQADPTWSQSTGSATNPTWANIAALMEAAQDTLLEVRQALKEPAADAGPCTNMLTGRRVNFVTIRTVAQWLMGAAECELHQGRLEPALQDLEALAGLANMEREEPTLVAQMIRVAVAGLGLEATWEALQAPGWTEPQLARLQKAWEPVDLVQAAEKGMVGERASGYELFTQIRRCPGPRIGRLFRSWFGSSASKASLRDLATDYFLLPAYKLACISDDELLYLKTMEEAIGAPRLLKARRPWPEAKQATATVSARLNAVAGTPGHYRYYVSLMSIPNFTRAAERACCVETERQMTLAVIGLKRYQLRHGNLPASLQGLAPEFLPAVPYDPMSGKPLCYRPKPDGSFVLYSVGEDGQDDGGDPNPAVGNYLGLWQGRDAVWPAAVSEASYPSGTSPRQPPRHHIVASP